VAQIVAFYRDNDYTLEIIAQQTNKHKHKPPAFWYRTRQLADTLYESDDASTREQHQH